MDREHAEVDAPVLDLAHLPLLLEFLMVPFILPSTVAPLPAPNEQQGDVRVQVHVALEHIVRPMLTTSEAAYYLNRKPQTLRIWACKDEGPIRPVRMYGRLGWRVSDIRRYLGVEQTHGAASGH